MALLSRMIQKTCQCKCLNLDSPTLARDALVLGPSAALNRNPTPVTSVNTPQAVSQPSVSQQSTISQSSCLASKSEQLQEQDFSVEVAGRNAAPQRSKRTVYKSKWVLSEMWCREILVDTSSSVKQVSDFLYTCSRT